ncbi:MAG: hypothetical protein CMJ46_11675 [Planctomyces sp.]|nr:hypothetical protein [Planctomyces sp.]
MKHHFSEWGPQVTRRPPASIYSIPEEEFLTRLEAILTECEAPTPKALKQSGLSDYCGGGLNQIGMLIDAAEKCRERWPEDSFALCVAIKSVIKGTTPLPVEDLRRLVALIVSWPELDLTLMPVDEIVKHLERHFGAQPLPGDWHASIQRMHDLVHPSTPKKSKTVQNLLGRIQDLTNPAMLHRLKPDDGWADRMREDLEVLGDTERRQWEELLGHLSVVYPEPPATTWEVGESELQTDARDREAFWREQTITFLKRQPATQWLETLQHKVHEIGVDDFHRMRLAWLQAIPSTGKPTTISQFSLNRSILEGLLWSGWHSGDPDFAYAVGLAGVFMLRNNSPLLRPAVQVLHHVNALNSTEVLSYLLSQAKAAIQKDLIEEARGLIAERRGISAGELNDLALPDSNFTELGRRGEILSGYTAELVVQPGDKVELRWYKPNGDPQKSLPAKVKREFPAEVRKLKATIKEVKATLATARFRLESAPLARRSWTSEKWRTRYIDHPVAGLLARRLIWNIEQEGQRTAAIFHQDRFIDVHDQEVRLRDDARITLWHPIEASEEEIIGWQNWLFAHELTQPFKQAHREIYVITDAERATEVYSNRFAAHIMAQSHFRALAKTRGWTAPYLGHWDGCDDTSAKREIPEWGLRVHFDHDGFQTDLTDPLGRGLLYLTSNHVRFFELEGNTVVPLHDVPPIVFTELMRDVDLFVGVCSMGNDPNWGDHGPGQQARDYWCDYSFGALSDSACQRREFLKNLIPRLKIADRCSFDDRFLIVRGDIRTYRIHIGSSNIQREPDNRYLCIVPKGIQENHDVFLPFEGDTRLSVILSKAFLLANDTAIDDPTIVRQIQN